MADSHLHESNFKRLPKLVKLYFKRNTITIKLVNDVGSGW